MQLLFDDLFAYDRHALCHLCVFSGTDGLVAVAGDPDDNPGRSVVNAAEELWMRVRHVFAPDDRPLRLFSYFASIGTDDHEHWSEIRDLPASATFHSADRTAVEALVGQRLERFTPSDYTCARIGGHRHPLLALIPEPEPERDLRRELAIVAVADLPWAHNPSRCPHHARFEQLSGFYESAVPRAGAVGAHWFLTLTEDNCANCRYHQADWRRVAEASVTVYQQLPAFAQPEDFDALAEKALDGDEEREWLVSLFADPIIWFPGSTSVTNGQHRSCALKASGAPLAVVDTHGEPYFRPEPADVRRRAQSALAAHWAGLLGR